MARLKRQRNPLMSLLRFDTQDMTFNRKGVMSPRQQQRFMRGGRGRALLTAALGGVVASAIGRGGADMSTFQFIFTQILNAVFFGWLTWTMHMDLFKDAVGGRVEQVSGKPTLQLLRNGRRLCIGDMAFPVSNPLLEVLNPDTSYCAYYAPNSNRLLALEMKTKSRPRATQTTRTKTSRTSRTTRSASIPVAPPQTPRRRQSNTPAFGSRANQESTWY